MTLKNLSKIHIQLLGFFLFSVVYLAAVNLYFMYTESQTPGFIPGTLIAGVIGYFLLGLFYDKYRE
ncbi:conserved hypothetical protein [Methanosalsum zhilinae DSM 4017]|uniref:Uncharacterized protein n=1 Tax=Methanosalsum zhilinae (strain DSM 4017 / NBRC 107636 / OCM 62 / WeN5) TaxID=679901 RepID=F7XK94_METZD|nr:conserved hypothetical protein [Methanosalsum zhilinae DSM 4017]